MEIVPGLHQIKLPMPGPLEYILSYVFKSDGGYTLVDPGWDSDQAFDAMKSQLAEIGASVAGIRREIITHMHHDHYGLTARVKEESGAEVLLHERDWAAVRPYMDDPQAVIKNIREWMAQQGVPQSEAADMQVPGETVRNIMLKAQPDRTLAGGEVIEGEGFRWAVIWTPGHSAGHICLYERDRKLLLAGDHVLPVITPHVSYMGYTGGDPLGDFLSSIRALKPLDVRTVLPAHEFVFEGLQRRLDEIEEHHKARMEEMIDALAPGPRTPYEIAHDVTWVTGDFRDFDFTMQGAAVRETLAHLEHLLAQGRVAKDLGEDGVYRYRLT